MRLVQRYRQHHREEIEQLNLKPILHSLIRSINCLAPEVSITLNINTAHPFILASRLELEQVIMNLSLNAVHAMQDQGELYIEVNEHTEQYKEIHVRDSGKGISAEDLPHIFEPFFTTKRHQGGTGIGLANVKQIIERWGGTIQVQSTVGQGTQFKLLLPTMHP